MLMGYILQCFNKLTVYSLDKSSFHPRIQIRILLNSRNNLE